MWGSKTDKAAAQAVNVLRENRLHRERYDNDLARQGARAYMEKLTHAIEVLSEFDDKRVPLSTDLNDMKKSLSDSGTACCLMTMPNGFRALLDSNGTLIATYMGGDFFKESMERDQ